MKVRHPVLFLLVLLLLGVGGHAFGQGRWHELPPDERRQMRQEMREHWQRDRELRREEGGGRRWQDVPADERRQMRQEMREQRQLRDGEFQDGRRSN